MEFTTKVKIEQSAIQIEPCEDVLLVGSCFADNIGRKFTAERFPATVNPFGVMYNPASVLHTVERTTCAPRTAILTLGTNHVYILNETDEIVDNCMKRPQWLFTEKELSVDECATYINRAIEQLQARRPDVRVILTVSPIRYAKYGFHGSRLSKAALLLAADKVVRQNAGAVVYFPAYEIMNDELRGYRFYAPDMLHPSEQAVEYIWQRFTETFFSERALQYLADYKPIKEAVAHRPFNPESLEYIQFMRQTLLKAETLAAKYKGFIVSEELLRFK